MELVFWSSVFSIKLFLLTSINLSLLRKNPLVLVKNSVHNLSQYTIPFLLSIHRWCTYRMMMSYWSIWDPRWLPCRTPPLPTTTHRLQLTSLSDGGRPGWGRHERARARCFSLPRSPRGGDRSQGTDRSCCTNTGMSWRPAEHDKDLRWFRHQRGWQGPESREADLLSKT